MIRRLFLVLVALFSLLVGCKNNATKENSGNSWKEVYKNAYTNHDYITAVVALNQLIIKDSSERPKYYDSLCLYYIKKLHNYDAGKKMVDKGLAINANNFQLLEYRSIFLSAEGKYDEARSVIKKAYDLSKFNKHLYMYATTYASEQNFAEFNKIANGILYSPDTKPELVEVTVDDNVSQMVDIKALCYLDKAKIAPNSVIVMRYIDSALMIEPNYQEALYYKQKLESGAK